ncbi:MAG TPA: nucleoside hydrolase [Pirellulales bacterium]|jgi:inosine-uridine nucleoside N-ribohydrolase|nr:nucleoside hydrolase [Pirellulales bacterium]
MARKVILDVDPGIDGAVALTMALFDPRLDVVAVTAVAGTISAEQATRNVQAIIEQLDPPRWPRIGSAAEPETAPARGGLSALYGADGLGNVGFQVAELHHQHPAEKVMTDELRKDPESVTILALGPLTNVAQVLRRDVKLSETIGQLVMRAGTISLPGDVTPAAEFNVYFDPRSARDVFRWRATKTLVPLDATRQVMLDYSFLDKLPPESTRAGRLLRRILPVAYRAQRQEQGIEGIYLNAPVALVAMTDPELFTIQPMAGDVEMSGDLTTGATIFDRRQVPEWRPNMEVVTEAEPQAVADAIRRGLDFAGSAG